ncbi:MAG TPA: hypothetical protein VM242_10435 [Acidimicrobiales bacterium]|jgi:hypothetical protein|nr:hypothetical protein [Acidimicrobiales bacterium]
MAGPDIDVDDNACREGTVEGGEEVAGDDGHRKVGVERGDARRGHPSSPGSSASRVKSSSAPARSTGRCVR